MDENAELCGLKIGMGILNSLVDNGVTWYQLNSIISLENWLFIEGKTNIVRSSGM